MSTMNRLFSIILVGLIFCAGVTIANAAELPEISSAGHTGVATCAASQYMAEP